MTNIFYQMNYKMKRKFLLESPKQWADITTQIVNNTKKSLKDYGYNDEEIASAISQNNFEVDMINDAFVLYQDNSIIYSVPRNKALLHTFPQEAENALLDWCIQRIGREPEYIDTSEWFDKIEKWNNTNESKQMIMNNKKTVRITESELKNIITESVKRILCEADMFVGTNRKKEVTQGNYEDVTINKTEVANDMVPDFVYTLATRLEKQLNTQCPKMFPDVEFCEFDIDVHVDNEEEDYETVKTYTKSSEHRLIFQISWDVAREQDEMIISDDKRFNNRIKSFVVKLSTMMLGNLEGAEIRFGESYGSSLVVILTFNDLEKWYDYGEHSGPRKINNRVSPLFKNNPARQIPGKNNFIK